MCKVGSTVISLLGGLLLTSNPFSQADLAVFMVHEIFQHKILNISEKLSDYTTFP